jgi:Peptidase family M23
VSAPRAIRAQALRVLALALAAVAALALGASTGLGAAPDTSASAYAVMINVPGAQSSSTGTSPAGSYQYRDLVSVASYTAGSALTYGQAYGHSELSGITLLGGAVTATSVMARASADGRSSSADGTFGGSVSGLVVDGADVSVQPGGQFPIPGLGWGAVDERRVLRSNGAYSGSEVGLHIHLTVGWHNLPAGTEILLGYAAAAAAGHPVIVAAKQPAGASGSAAPPARGGTASTSPVAIGAPVVPVPPGDQTPSGEGGGNVPTGIEAPPPGGFTATPPISPASAKQLLGPGYVFPVAGGANYGNDFGAPRSDTGFHQGSDLFAPEGTPVVAVQSGTLRNVGWNRLGGWRLWIEDVNGNWFYYAHLSAYAPIAKEGAHVNAGDVVGFVGHTGDAVGTPSHLHFEIHPGGQWAVPPYDYLQAWQGHRNPFAAIPTVPPPPPPVAASQLDSTDISSASGLDTASVLAVAAGTPLDDGLVALGVPAPTAQQLLAAALGA